MLVMVEMLTAFRALLLVIKGVIPEQEDPFYDSRWGDGLRVELSETKLRGSYVLDYGVALVDAELNKESTT